MACNELSSNHGAPVPVYPVTATPNREELHDLIRKAREKIISSGHYDVDSPPQDLGVLLQEARREQLADENELAHKQPIRKCITEDTAEPHIEKMRTL